MPASPLFHARLSLSTLSLVGERAGNPGQPRSPNKVPRNWREYASKMLFSTRFCETVAPAVSATAIPRSAAETRLSRTFTIPAQYNRIPLPAPAGGLGEVGPLTLLCSTRPAAPRETSIPLGAQTLGSSGPITVLSVTRTTTFFVLASIPTRVKSRTRLWVIFTTGDDNHATASIPMPWAAPPTSRTWSTCSSRISPLVSLNRIPHTTPPARADIPSTVRRLIDTVPAPSTSKMGPAVPLTPVTNVLPVPLPRISTLFPGPIKTFSGYVPGHTRIDCEPGANAAASTAP